MAFRIRKMKRDVKMEEVSCMNVFLCCSLQGTKTIGTSGVGVVSHVTGLPCLSLLLL